MEKHELLVLAEEEGKRLDAYISEKIEGRSRTYMQKLVQEQQVFVNGQSAKSNYKTKSGDRIVVQVPDPVALNIEAENIPLDIVYEDHDIIIINKPQGMVVHPAHGNYSGTMVNALLSHCVTDGTEEDENSEHGLSGINGVLRPGIVHRIDKDTSGIIMIAKTDEAHISLSAQLKAHTITRKYIALVEGPIKNELGHIETLIGRDSKDRKKMAVVNRNGKHAVTHYKVLEVFNGYTLIQAELETGRTHQIRVHMAFIGHPVVGDTVYGFKKQKFDTKGQLLHAQVLGFIHPTTKQYVVFEAPLPKYFEDILSILRNKQS